MIIYFELFFTFFKIGLFTIGGGYAMIPMIMQEVAQNAWLDYNMLFDFIAIAESTPGAFAINIATFIGSTVGGASGGLIGSIFGAMICTIGVVLPSVIIISLIALLFNNLTKNKYVKSAFEGLSPAVVGLIAAACLSIAIKVFFDANNISKDMFASVDFLSIFYFVVLLILSRIKINGKKISPIMLILIAAVLGLSMMILGV